MEQYLRKQTNVDIILDAEITSMEWDDQVKGNVAVIRTGYGGHKTSQTYISDALVLCTTKASHTLYRYLRYSLPVLPYK